MPESPKKITAKKSKKISEETKKKLMEETGGKSGKDHSNEEDNPKDSFDESLEKSSSVYDYSSLGEISFSSKSMELSPTPIRRKRKVFSLFEPNLTNKSCSSVSEENSIKVLEENSVNFSKVQSFTSAKFETADNTKIYALIGFIIIGLLIVCWRFDPGINPTEISDSQPSSFEIFANNINELKREFKYQEKRFWRTVVSSGRHILNVTQPDYPAVLLFVTNNIVESEDYIDVSSCLANKVSWIFANANGHTDQQTAKIDCGKLDKSSVSNEKLSLDENLKHYLQDKQYKSVVINNLELLSPEAALLFHGYCDGDNAPFKDVMIVLVLHIKEVNLNTRSAEKLLRDLWEKKLDVDKVGALMSRVANNVAVVNPEAKSSVILNSCA